jgi:hypothetical protein
MSVQSKFPAVRSRRLEGYEGPIASSAVDDLNEIFKQPRMEFASERHLKEACRNIPKVPPCLDIIDNVYTDDGTFWLYAAFYVSTDDREYAFLFPPWTNGKEPDRPIEVYVREKYSNAHITRIARGLTKSFAALVGRWALS